MRFFLPLILILISPMPAMTNKHNEPNIPANPATSQELSSLNDRHTKLQGEHDRLTADQDFWHKWATGLGITAAICGVLAGASAVFESRKTFNLRCIDSQISTVDAGIADWKKRDSDFKISELNEKAEREKLARVKLEQSIRFIGSRGEALKASRNLIISHLEKFKSQKVFRRVCGGELLGGNNEEIMFTENALAHIFFDARWDMFPKGPPPVNDWLPDIDRSCIGGAGVGVRISPDAPNETRLAADALATQLTRILGQALEPSLLIHTTSCRPLTPYWCIYLHIPRNRNIESHKALARESKLRHHHFAH